MMEMQAPTGRRVAPLVLQEIQLLLQQNTPMMLADFDGLVRQFLHAIYSTGGKASLEYALESLHVSTERTPREAIRNWPAYINTYLKKFFRGLARAPTRASGIISDTLEVRPKTIAPVRRSRLNPHAMEFYPSAINRIAMLGVIKHLNAVQSSFWNSSPMHPPSFPLSSPPCAFPTTLTKVLATGVSYAGNLADGQNKGSPSNASVSSLADSMCKLQQERVDAWEISPRGSFISDTDSFLCKWEMADSDEPEHTSAVCTDSDQTSLEDGQLIGSREVSSRLDDVQDGFIVIPSHPEDSMSVCSSCTDFVMV
eukprot:TRINITY_DN34111_c0_g1_i1.p1 TRINITY_DN34111_c0_g1~~TRINITY_DN34111_c0_g1_i1.p1  ORF type:complete len:311 (-),score=36.94 TRINITY_DN34111_c0_g1_i1:147-1079(-)